MNKSKLYWLIVALIIIGAISLMALALRALFPI